MRPLTRKTIESANCLKDKQDAIDEYSRKSRNYRELLLVTRALKAHARRLDQLTPMSPPAEKPPTKRSKPNETELPEWKDFFVSLEDAYQKGVVHALVDALILRLTPANVHDDRTIELCRRWEKKLGEETLLRPPEPPSKVQDGYQSFRHALIAQFGSYCSYCEMPIGSGLQVEHMLPKSSFGDFATLPRNLLLACSTCNSIKLARPSFSQQVDDWIREEMQKIQTGSKKDWLNGLLPDVRTNEGRLKRMSGLERASECSLLWPSGLGPTQHVQYDDFFKFFDYQLEEAYYSDTGVVLGGGEHFQIPPARSYALAAENGITYYRTEKRVASEVVFVLMDMDAVTELKPAPFFLACVEKLKSSDSLASAQLGENAAALRAFSQEFVSVLPQRAEGDQRWFDWATWVLSRLPGKNVWELSCHRHFLLEALTGRPATIRVSNPSAPGGSGAPIQHELPLPKKQGLRDYKHWRCQLSEGLLPDDVRVGLRESGWMPASYVKMQAECRLLDVACRPQAMGKELAIEMVERFLVKPANGLTVPGTKFTWRRAVLKPVELRTVAISAKESQMRQENELSLEERARNLIDTLKLNSSSVGSDRLVDRRLYMRTRAFITALESIHRVRQAARQTAGASPLLQQAFRATVQSTGYWTVWKYAARLLASGALSRSGAGHGMVDEVAQRADKAVFDLLDDPGLLLPPDLKPAGEAK